MATILDCIPAGTMKLAARGQDGPEYSAPCPWCGGRDRFQVWPEHHSGKPGGKFYCRQCGKSGDGIAFLMDFQGLGFKAAQAALGSSSSGAGHSLARQSKATQRPSSEPPDAKQKEGWAKAASLAQRMYAACGESPGHPYLDRKGVLPYRGIRALSGEAIRLFGEAIGQDRVRMTGGEVTGLLIGGKTFMVWDLVVPLSLPGVGLASLQFVNGDQADNKRALPGGRKQGACFILPGREEEPLCLAEGLATALSINQTTGYEAVMCVDAGNLLPVARAMRERWPGREMVICGDSDPTGRAKAEEAARAINAVLFFPEERRAA